MRRLAFVLSIVFMIAVSSSWALAIEKEQRDMSKLIEEEIWIYFTDEPSDYFQDAREDFLEGDLEDSAYNIRKAAAFIKLQAYRATKGTKKVLMAAAKKLEKLAKSVEEGSLADPDDLEDTFAQAEYALAQHYYEEALEYESKGEEAHEELLYALDAAAIHLLYALLWADEDLDKEDIVAVKESRSVAKKILKGAAWAPKKVGSALKSIARGIQKMGKRIKPLELEEE